MSHKKEKKEGRTESWMREQQMCPLYNNFILKHVNSTVSWTSAYKGATGSRLQPIYMLTVPTQSMM